MGNGISEALKLNHFLGEHAPTPPPPLEARAFGACFSTPSCAYLNGKTTLHPCNGKNLDVLYSYKFQCRNFDVPEIRKLGGVGGDTQARDRGSQNKPRLNGVFMSASSRFRQVELSQVHDL